MFSTGQPREDWDHPMTTAERVSGEQVDPSPPDTRRQPRESLPLLVAVVAVIVPVLVATVRGASQGWIPTGDDGYTALRAWDVFSAHPPLRGSISSLSGAVGRNIFHPGTLQYDVLAVPMRLFGRGWGVAIGIALTKVLSIVGIAWLLRRRLGVVPATIAVAAVGLLVLSMGSERLYDPWHTHAGLLPFALFLVAVWCVVAGDPVALVPMVIAGSYVTQSHLSFAVPVAGVVAFAVVAVAFRLWHWRRDPAEAERWPERRGRALRWAAITVAVTVVSWAQPLWQQVTNPRRGNLVELVRASTVDLPKPALADVTRAYGGTVALPPWWLPPSFGSPAFAPDGSGPPLLLASAGLVSLVALLTVLGRRAWQRGAIPIAAGAAVSVAALVVGAVTLWRLPVLVGLTVFYLRWMWPLAMVVWTVVVVAFVDEWQQRRPGRSGRVWVARGAATVAVVAGLAALPTVNNTPPNPDWTVVAVDSLASQVIEATEGEETVVVSLQIDWPTIFTGPPLLGELQQAGVPLRIGDPVTLAQAGNHYRPRPGESGVELMVRGGAVDPQEGESVVASWSGLTAAEAAELDRLGDRIAEVIADDGLMLAPDAEASFDELDMTADLAALRDAPADPDELLAGPSLWQAVVGGPSEYAGHPLVDEEPFGSGVLERWAELAEKHELAQVAVYALPE
jgi:hypothetical protein